MDDWRNRSCDSYRCWRCGFVVRRVYCLHGKRRKTSAPNTRGAGLGKMGLWRSAGAIRCRPRYREEWDFRTASPMRMRCSCSSAAPIPIAPGADGMTFGKMLMDHRAHFQRTLKRPPAEFAALWDWAEKHGVVQQAQ